MASIYQDAICFLFTLEAFIVTAKPSKLPQPTAPPVESWVFFVLHSTAPASLKSALPGRAERICLWWVSERTKKIVSAGVDYEAVERFEDPYAMTAERSVEEADEDVERTWVAMMGKEEWRSKYVMNDAMYADSEYEKVMSEIKSTNVKKSCHRKK